MVCVVYGQQDSSVGKDAGKKGLETWIQPLEHKGGGNQPQKIALHMAVHTVSCTQKVIHLQ